MEFKIRNVRKWLKCEEKAEMIEMKRKRWKLSVIRRQDGYIVVKKGEYLCAHEFLAGQY